MALRLRRGTDAERLLITPLQGELIYTNDTKQLYAGDGTTAGGTLVSGSGGGGSTTLDALTDTDLTGAADNSVLTFDVGTNKWTAVNTFTGNVVGDVVGSVFGDDSSVIVDSVNNTIVGTRITTERLTINNTLVADTVLSISSLTSGTNGANIDFFGSRDSLDAPTVLVPGDSILDINANGWDGTAQTPAAVIKFAADKYTSSIGSGVMPGRIIFLTFNESGNTGIDNAMIFNRFGNLGIKTDNPAEALDVRGNATIEGFVQFGSLTTTERNALTAANGMVIYNTTDDKFQGYENGAWVNLV